MTTYKIHLKNRQENIKKFWCFLDTPISDISPQVFANSNANINISTHREGKDDSFSIPLKYSLMAGASNKAVGKNTLIESSISQLTELGTAWDTEFSSTERIGPDIKRNGDSSDVNRICINTGAYDKTKEETSKWYNNLTFGVESTSGFMGVTWSPDPSEIYEIKPKVQFYITCGRFEENTLVEMKAISRSSAQILESHFDGNFECTVTLEKNGEWTIEKGNTNKNKDRLKTFNELLVSHAHLTDAHSQLVSMGSNIQYQYNTVPHEEDAISAGIVINDDDKLSLSGSNDLITGTITLTKAVTFMVAAMIVGGLKIKVSKVDGKSTEYTFEYSGEFLPEVLKRVFGKGNTLTVSEAKE